MKRPIPSFRSYRALLLIVAALAITALLPAFRSPAANKEKLLGISFNYDKSEVTLTVFTSGCTTKADFSFKVSGSNLQVIRLKNDPCKMVPQAVSFTYTLAEAGLKADRAYVVTNKFIANPMLAAIP